MKLKVTLDIYSGRPNPTVEIDGAAADDLLARLRPVKSVGSRSAAPVAAGPVLGYRGILVEETGVKRGKAPRVIRVANGKVFDGMGAHLPADGKVEDFVCGSGGPIRFPGAPPKLDKLIAISGERSREARSGKSMRLRWPTRITCPCAPLYEPAWWNDGGLREFDNNCYNYATNYRSDTFAQPGLAAGAMYAALTGPEVRAAAVRDELIDSLRTGNKCPKEGHLVALVIWPGADFHWYRRGRNSMWTHKPGSTPATNLSNSGVIIPDPRTADRGPYTEFTTFMIVMHGHIKVA